VNLQNPQAGNTKWVLKDKTGTSEMRRSLSRRVLSVNRNPLWRKNLWLTGWCCIVWENYWVQRRTSDNKTNVRGKTCLWGYGRRSLWFALRSYLCQEDQEKHENLSTQQTGKIKTRKEVLSNTKHECQPSGRWLTKQHVCAGLVLTTCQPSHDEIAYRAATKWPRHRSHYPHTQCESFNIFEWNVVVVKLRWRGYGRSEYERRLVSVLKSALQQVTNISKVMYVKELL
jgi:hypothetical protein